MKKIITSFFLIFSLSSFGGQGVIQDIFSLDTILTIPQSNLYRDKINITCFEKEIWVYLPGKRDDTLDFAIINLETKRCEYVNCPFPSMYFKIMSPTSADIAVSKNYITLFISSDKQLFVLNRKNNTIKLQSVIPIVENLDFLSLKGNELFFAKHYNYNPKSSDKKTILGKFNLITNKLVKYIEPPFKNIEFSHFSPKQWVDFGEEWNYFSQTTKYKINIYNNNLDCVDSIVHIKKEWSTVSQSQLDEVYKLKKSSKSLLTLLAPYEDEITRIESIYQMNDTVLFVVWIPPYQKKNKYYRKLDVWKKNENGKFEIIKENLLDTNFKLTDTICKKHFPIRMNFNTNYFYANTLVQWKFGSEVNPLNKTQKEVYMQNEAYSMDKEDVYVIKIFKINEL